MAFLYTNTKTGLLQGFAGNSPRIPNVHPIPITQPPQPHQRLKPLLQIPGERSRELCVGKEAVHRHAVAGVDVLVEFPRGAEEGGDGCRGASVPADGELAAFVLEPEEGGLAP